MFEFISIAVLTLYILILLFLRNGLTKFTSAKNHNLLPKVTVVVAARNEEANIALCINSLKLLDYPEALLEVIIVNDNSTDETVINAKKEIKGDVRFKIIDAGVPDGKLKGKPLALETGIQASQGDIIFITDADCVVPKNWIKETVKFYDSDTGAVFSFTSVKGNKVFERIQNLDLLYLISVAAGSLNNGMPVSCIGNNMSFRSEVYRQCGGYKEIPFSVTEDFALLMAMKMTRHSLKYVLGNETKVYTNPLKTTEEIYRQKKRWAVGGLDVPFMEKMLIVFLAAGSIMPFVSLAIEPVPGIALFVIKFLVDYFFMLPVVKALNERFTVGSGLLFQLYLCFYLLLLPGVLLVNRTVIWKGREFNRG